MPPVPEYVADAKLVGSIIGATLGGIILLGILPFILFGSFLFFRNIWRAMFIDRAQYLLDEETRAAWNAEARREARLRYNAMALVRQWARKNGIMVTGTPLDMSVLVHMNYFPVRQYQRHVIIKSILYVPTQIRFRWFNSGPIANLQITKSEWEEARARATGQCNIELRSFEQIFWKDQPPPYYTIVDNHHQVYDNY